MLSCYAILIAAGAWQERARRASKPPMDIGVVPAETIQRRSARQSLVEIRWSILSNVLAVLSRFGKGRPRSGVSPQL